jgi:hypothetical protein
MPIQAGNYRSSLTWNIYKNRGGRPTVLASIKYPRKHDRLGTTSPLKVVGRRSEIAAVGPIPGRTPTRVPIAHPTKAKRRFSGRKATENAYNIVSMSAQNPKIPRGK